VQRCLNEGRKVHNDGGERGEGGVQDRSLFPPPVVPAQCPGWQISHGEPVFRTVISAKFVRAHTGCSPCACATGVILPHLAGFQGSPPQTSHFKLPMPGRWPDSEPLTAGSTPPNIDIRINSSEAQSTGYPTGCSRRPLAVEPGSGLFKDAKPAIRLHEEVISRTLRHETGLLVRHGYRRS
jgi:hypothetical protein